MEDKSGEEKPKTVSVPIYLFSLFGTIGLIITAWVALNRSDASQEVRLSNLEIRQERVDQKIDAKTEKILDKLEQINTTLANKQDRSR